MNSNHPLAPCELTDLHCQLIEYMNDGGPMMEGDLFNHLVEVDMIDPRDHVRFDTIFDDLKKLELIREYSYVQGVDGPFKSTPHAGRDVLVELTGLGSVILKLHSIKKKSYVSGLTGRIQPTTEGGAMYCPWLHWHSVSYHWHRARAKALAKNA